MKRCASALLIAISAFPLTALAAPIDMLAGRIGTPAFSIIEAAACPTAEIDAPFELEDVILRAICMHPRARQTWAAIQARISAVGSARSAYLPSLSARAGIQRDTVSTRHDYSAYGLGSVDRSQTMSASDGSLELTWLLFDFGRRGANVRQTRALLAAAHANHDETLQTIFFDAARAFYAVRDSQAAVRAAQLTEDVAVESVAIARAKHEAGAGTLSDQLQAITSYRRAVLDRVTAEGDARTAAGLLSVAMGLGPNVPIRISTADTIPDERAVTAGIDSLIDEAKTRHPALVAARAILDAARADVDAAHAEGRPTLSLAGKRTRNKSFGQRSGEAPVSPNGSSTIGIQLTIPLIDGFGSRYRVAHARARADEREAELRNTELLISAEVWKSYHGLQADAANLTNSRDLLEDADRSLDIARGRYKEGVGTFTELLNAQAARADAERQRVQAVSKWRMSRLRLATSLGNLRLSRPDWIGRYD
ncbi:MULTISPECIES: TolC family protein [Burkholderia]|uniref:TolC family protein n=1 Tax=Burkholderia TaxID=32008 RepID=UPI00080B5F26|nr:MULTISPECIES: TolC family protein [Burkholderia]MCA8478122.1 TolC family protein [Burkholderia multivorans]MDR9049627.1 Outer membrane protein TolC [Burkholderia multivorans]MDR9056172.1 Outer membrane protein TolC [Burkholderia multivorans]MDR9061835.1 Outer membrane protein TolC [Burkholderia multivorans]MDR9069377.1 Outer membrane protein TolC [Burkholderia multivorans]